MCQGRFTIPVFIITSTLGIGLQIMSDIGHAAEIKGCSLESNKQISIALRGQKIGYALEYFIRKDVKFALGNSIGVEVPAKEYANIIEQNSGAWWISSVSMPIGGDEFIGDVVEQIDIKSQKDGNIIDIACHFVSMGG